MEYMATGYQDKKIRVDRALESFGTSEVLSEGWCVQYVCDEAGKSSGLESGGFGQVRRGWAGYGVLQYQVTYREVSRPQGCKAEGLNSANLPPIDTWLSNYSQTETHITHTYGVMRATQADSKSD